MVRAPGACGETGAATVLCCDALEQSHFGARHQPIDIEQNHHSLVDCAETDEVIGIQRDTHFRGRLDLLRAQADDV
jgi:hypothetical protein